MTIYTKGEHTVTGLTAQGGTQNGPSGWDTISFDSASYYDGAMTDAVGVNLLIQNDATAQDQAVGVRKTGSTDVLYRDMRRASQTHVSVGVNASGQADIAIEDPTDMTVVVLGWWGADGAFFNTNAQASGGVASADTYEAQAVTSEAGDTAKVAFYQEDGGGQTNFNYCARHGDASSYDRPETVFRNGYGHVALNASEEFDWRCNNTTPQLRIMGYLFSDDITVNVEPPDRNASLSDGVYGTITTPTADFVGYRSVNVSTSNAGHAWALRDSGDSTDHYLDQNRETAHAVVPRGTGIQAKLEDVSDQELYELWYGSNPTGGETGAVTFAAEAGATFGAVASAQGSITEGAEAAQTDSAQAGALATVLSGATGDATLDAVAQAAAAMVAGAQAGESWAAQAIAQALLVAAGEADDTWLGETVGAQSGAMAAGTDAGDAFAAAAATLASLVEGATADDAAVALVAAFGSVSFAAQAGSTFSAFTGNLMTILAGAESDAVMTAAVAASAVVLASAQAGSTIAAAATAAASVTFGAQAGATFAFPGAIGLLIGELTTSPAVEGTLTTEPTVEGDLSSND